MQKYRQNSLIRTGFIGLVVIVLIIAVGMGSQQLLTTATSIRYQALFAEAGGLTSGNEVKVSGVTVGNVTDVALEHGRAKVTFAVDGKVRLGRDTTAHIGIGTLLGERVLVLEPRGSGSLGPLGVIPLTRPASPYSLTDAVGEFTANTAQTDTAAINHALDTLSDTIERLSPQLAPTFDGVARLSRSLNQRNESLRELLAAAADVTGLLSERSQQVNTLLLNANDLLAVLDARRQAIVDLMANVTAVSRELRGLIADNEAELAPTLDRLNSVMAMLERNRENIAKILPSLKKFMLAQGETLAGKHRETLETLLAMSGRTLSVRRDGRVPMPTLVGYRRTIPDDLLPLVVLDASGRVRTTYDDLATTMPLVRLPAAHKDYSGLTIRVWDRGGGKSSFGTEKAAEPIVSAIADLIESSDDTGRWLVVGHKQVEGRVVDVEGTLRRRLSPAKSALVDFIPWGNHAASNDYADASRVVLAGTLFLPRSGYEALKRLCLDRDPDQLALTDDDLTDTEMGEHGHYVLQALCRASVRKAEEGGTRPCTAYIIASKRSGIRNRLPEWFPGCRVESWEPRGPKPLTGHSKMVFDYVTRWAAAKEPGAKLKFSKVYGDLHIHPDVFRDVRANERLKAALAERGITEGGGGKLMTHYTLVARVSESRVSDV